MAKRKKTKGNFKPYSFVTGLPDTPARRPSCPSPSAGSDASASASASAVVILPELGFVEVEIEEWGYMCFCC
jgi:hypothetical protein